MNTATGPAFLSLPRSLALCVALIVPLPAIAQPLPPPDPAALGLQLQQWLADRLGPHAAADLRVRVTPQDDHDRVAVALRGPGHGGETTASVRAGADGRWLIDDLRIPSGRFGVTGDRGLREVEIRTGGQDSHARVDPELRSPCSLDLALRDVTVAGHGPRLQQQAHADRLDAHARLTPNGDQFDFDHQAALTGWRSTLHQTGAPAVAVAAAHMEASGHVGGLDHVRADSLLAAVAGLLATLPADALAAQAGAPLPSPARAALAAWMDALRNPGTDARGEDTIAGLHVAVAGEAEASARQLRLAAKISAPHGLVQGWLDIGIDGLRVSGLPAGEAALVPTRVALRPTVAGVRLADLTTLILEATEPGTDPHRLQADARALLAQRGVAVGLDTLSVSLGPATLHGNGQVSRVGRDGYAGEAHFTATGFDALMAQAARDPGLQRSLPVLAVMRGFARPQGDHLVWDIVARDGRLSVNGIPLSADRDDHGDRR